MLFQQSTRLAQVNCPLGPDVLLLKSLGGGEELGRLFDYQLQLASSDANIDLNQLLGKPMGLSVQLDGGGQRYFHGIVARCSQNIDTGQFASYEVTLRPWLWLLSRTSDCRIFQNLSIPQIIKQVFRDLGFSDFEDALSRPYREWEYCVQYRETSFDFVSRLMEQEGIYYFFRHEKDRHVVVLADAYGAHSSVPGYASVPYYPRDEQQRERDHMFDWHLAQEVQPGSLELNDYDFQRPSARIDVRSAMPRPTAPATTRSTTTPAPTCRAATASTMPRPASRPCKACMSASSSAATPGGWEWATCSASPASAARTRTANT
ncbi:hypothetical protein PBOI14_75860 [Pseudomonas sp. Boi14]|nr:hypothetical protein PBOI14_75860 [Pseudomonas sp. Boi14]